jgi:hypothetical protein
MRILKYMLIWGLAGVGIVIKSCAYENEEELYGINPCQPNLTTYSEVVEPIIANNCALPNCHNGSNPALPDWSILENVQASALKIKERTGNRTMPPSSSGIVLTAKQIDEIACWVDSGAQNN